MQTLGEAPEQFNRDDNHVFLSHFCSHSGLLG